MRPEAIVFPPPALDKDLCFGQRIQHLAVEKFIPKLSDEGLDVAVLPEASGFDEERGYAKVFEPVPDRVRREFRAVIRPNMLRYSSRQEQLVELFQNSL